jgi:four helix bundle protein
MPKIEKFEDIEAWQDSRALVKIVYTITQHGSFQKDWGLKDQIQRAAVSIMSNIAEGFERKSDKELCQFLFIAKGSAGEFRSLSYVAYDAGYIDKPTFESLLNSAEIISRKLSSFIKYLHGHK